MAEHTVDRLRLTVEAHRPDPRWRAAAEGLTRRVLEACGELLEARAPGRLVFLRSLPVRWHLGAGELDDPTVTARLARDVADAIGSVIESGSGAANDEWAVFASDAAFVADALEARGAGSPRWFHGDVAETLLTEPLDLPGRERLRAAVAELARAGRLDAVVATLPSREAARVRGALEGASRDAAGASVPPRAVPADPPRLDDARPLAISRAAAPTEPATVVHEPTAVRRELRDAAVRAEAEAPPPAAAPDEAASAQDAMATGLAGLFYLIAPWLELETGEALWRACLPEGSWIGAAAAAMGASIGPEGEADPAPAVIGGVEVDAGALALSPAQHAEIAPAALAAVAEALPRRGLAALPVLELALAPAGPARLLVARAVGSAFVLFAWPVIAPRDAEAALGELFRVWPASAPPVRAAPAVAEIARGIAAARVTVTREADRVPPFLPPAGDGAATALLAMLAGGPAYLLSARAGLAPDSAAALVRGVLARPGRIARTADSVIVTLPAGAIDIRLRRAGLDRDPGFVPWLGATVRFVFAEGEAL